MLNSAVFNALNNPGNAKITPGTDRIKQVLKRLGNPQYKYKVIHITGSNGKGSTAAFIETGLCHAGYRVGKFSSPHIKTINECISLNHQPIKDGDLETHFYQVQQVLDNHNINLSPFELLTAVMFDYFANKGIDYLVLEVGMGGEDDATNVYPDDSDNVLISIITNISLEHTAFLGNTLTQIAKAKAGIIKNGQNVIPTTLIPLWRGVRRRLTGWGRYFRTAYGALVLESGTHADVIPANTRVWEAGIPALTIIADNTPELTHAVENKTQNYINVLNYYNFIVTLDYEKFQTIVEINNPDTKYKEVYTLNLFGKFQAYNFLCAYHALNYLKTAQASINYSAINTKNPGRLEVKERNPLLILDASHNLAGVKSLVATLDKRFNPEDVVIIASILADKDVTNMLGEFASISSSIICTTMNNPRCLPLPELSQIANKYFTNVQSIEQPSVALKLAKNMNKSVILITGSIYLLSYF